MDELNKRIVSYIDFISTLDYYDNTNTFGLDVYLKNKEIFYYEIDRKNRVSIKNEGNIFCKCYYCNTIFLTQIKNLKKIAKSKYLNDRIVCRDNRECFKKKNIDILTYMHSIGKSPATGKLVTVEEIRKRLQTIEERYGENKYWSEKRRGVSLIELYGKEKGEFTLSLLKKAYDERAKQGIYPHSNKKHSHKSKELMSKKKVEFISKERKIKSLKYVSPITNEKVDIFTYRSHVAKKYNNSLSKEQKKSINQKLSEAISDIVLNRRQKICSYKTGEVVNWFDNTFEFYESSYEKRLMYLLNKKKYYWKRNRIIKIQYVDEFGVTKYYIPDILLYTDSSFSTIQRIIEVKPKKFLNVSINILKKECLRDYCKSHKYKYSFITLEKIKRLEKLHINEN